VGLISGIFKLPLSPVLGTVWVAERMLEQAESEYYDEGAIQSQLRDIDAARQAGEISDEEADRAEDALLERLLEGRARGAGA
jgi:gas vesicle protein GvpG